MTPIRGIRIFLLIMAVSIITACATPQSTSVPPATGTFTPPPVPTDTTSPTLVPTALASPTTAATSPATPTAPGLFLPNGIATVPSAGGVVDFYDLQGQKIGELQAPNLGSGLYQQAHIAGSLTVAPTVELPPLVFYAFQNNGELWLNNGGSLSLIIAAPNLFNLVGIPGRASFAYSLPEYTDAGVRSLVFIGDSQTLPSAAPVLDSTNSQSYAIKPLAIATSAGQPTGIWYTTVPYGIGGNIVFEPRSGLYYLELASQSMNSYLDLTKSPAGISGDMSWVAFTSSPGPSPVTIMHDYDSATKISFPLQESSDRGAGDAAFSPDNQLVAWREAGGGLDDPSTLHQAVRIASVDGTILTEIPDTSLAAVTGFSQVGAAIPIGWLDTQTLVVEAKDSNSNAVTILKVNADGTGLSVLVTGSFIGFLYPQPPAG